MNKKEKIAIENYYKEICKQKILSTEKEKQLSEEIKKGNKRALDQFVTANLRIVVAIANEFQGKGVDMSDLISEGNIALIKAAEKFDGTHNTKFVTFAAPIIRKSMEKAIDTLVDQYQSPNNWNKNIGITQKKPISVDAPLNNKSNVTLLQVLQDKDAPDANIEIHKQFQNSELRSLIKELDERERRVIQYFYGMNDVKLSMAEIGNIMNLKRERVRQIRDKAIRKINKKANKKLLNLLSNK